MKLGFHIYWWKERWFGKGNNYSIKVSLPTIALGYIDNYEIKWFGFKFNLKTDISFESYEYGKTISLIILGFGIKINKFSL